MLKSSNLQIYLSNVPCGTIAKPLIIRHLASKKHDWPNTKSKRSTS
jgi:hypothetical protein